MKVLLRSKQFIAIIRLPLLIAIYFRKIKPEKSLIFSDHPAFFSFILFNPQPQLRMKLLTQPLTRLLTRFRYPVSLPEEVAADLGLNISNALTFEEFITSLTNPSHRPTKLMRFMPRAQADGMFQTALRKELFKQNSLFSYHFNGGWMEFMLQFDEQSRLRRLYIQHKDLKQKYEIPISQ